MRTRPDPKGRLVFRAPYALGNASSLVPPLSRNSGWEDSVGIPLLDSHPPPSHSKLLFFLTLFSSFKFPGLLFSDGAGTGARPSENERIFPRYGFGPRWFRLASRDEGDGRASGVPAGQGWLSEKYIALPLSYIFMEISTSISTKGFFTLR